MASTTNITPESNTPPRRHDQSPPSRTPLTINLPPFKRFRLIRFPKPPRLSLFGRSALLLGSELLVNAICWIVAGVLFGRKKDTQPILSLALLAWTIGLRHALDADHISAIDNATRSLMNLGQLPVTCGLFFSLGHSTIVIAVNVAIAISTGVADRIDGVGNIGGIVGTAISASFLFIIGLANSIILFKILRKRRRISKERRRRLARGENPSDVEASLEETIASAESTGNTLMMKIIGPIVTFVNAPWKMYPVGVLFGFGFDTASSIALLAVSALAKKGTNGTAIPPASIVILPVLFTAGMTLIDSLDSIIMLYSYAGFPDKSFKLFEPSNNSHISSSSPPTPNTNEKLPTNSSNPDLTVTTPPMTFLESDQPTDEREKEKPVTETPITTIPTLDVDSEKEEEENVPEKTLDVQDIKTESQLARAQTHADVGELAEKKTESSENIVQLLVIDVQASEEAERKQRVKRNAMSGLSVLLTLMSILVAFSISIIEIMGLIESRCTQCQAAANADDGHGGGLAGRWWRGWVNANNNSGYIGAAIVGGFVAIVAVWYGSRKLWVVLKRRREVRVIGDAATTIGVVEV